MKLSLIPIFVAVTLISHISTSAQDEVVRIETNIVTLNVAVTDKAGNYIRSLSKDQFVITDNGVRQDIDSFSNESAPASIGIVYNMRSAFDEQTGNVLDALRQFTQKLGQRDRYFVDVFGRNGSLTTEFIPTEEQLKNFVESGTGQGMTSLYDAIIDASKKVASMGNPKRLLIILSDGADQNSQTSLKVLRKRLQTVNVPVYSVTFGRENLQKFSYADMYRTGPRQTFDRFETSELDKYVLTELSKSTGGLSFEGSLRNRYYLTALCDKVLKDINNQYIIGFYPDVHDGRWHKLTVSVKDRGHKLKVTSRRGYQSPARR
jgi:Ca-activated chloride channel family protein